jgi:uncharacterized protein (TIGR03905 family)
MVKKMRNKYVPTGVCSSLIEYEIDDNGVIKYLKVTDGCNGNLQGISKLCIGRNIDEVINDLNGIRCRNKPTSRPDQIAKAFIEYKLNNK